MHPICSCLTFTKIFLGCRIFFRHAKVHAIKLKNAVGVLVNFRRWCLFLNNFGRGFLGLQSHALHEIKTSVFLHHDGDVHAKTEILLADKVDVH